MIKSQIRFLILGLIFLSSSALKAKDPIPPSIHWMSWSEAMAANKVAPKKIMIDLFTEWCGWCKKMDASTFMAESVVEYVNKNFYAIKFDAEQKDSIIFDNKVFNFISDGRRGVHQLAYALLDGKLGYPTLVYLTGQMERIMISPGYKDTSMLLKEMKFASEDLYLNTKWEDYQKN